MSQDHIEGFMLGLSAGVLLAYFFRMPDTGDIPVGSGGRKAGEAEVNGSSPSSAVGSANAVALPPKPRLIARITP